MGNWVTFTGTKATMGALHGDPGIFFAGTGKVLEYGTSVTYKGYRCRSATEGLYCRSLAHRSALLTGPYLMATFGCTEIRPQYYGREYICGTS